MRARRKSMNKYVLGHTKRNSCVFLALSSSDLAVWPASLFNGSQTDACGAYGACGAVRSEVIDKLALLRTRGSLYDGHPCNSCPIMSFNVTVHNINS